MLLRVAECCAVLLGRFATDVDMRDSCSELVLKLKVAHHPPLSSGIPH